LIPVHRLRWPPISWFKTSTWAIFSKKPGRAIRQVNFLLDPKPKDFSLVSLSTKLRVTGTLLQPKVRPDALSIETKAVKFHGYLALGPFGLLAPFVHLGAHKKHPYDIPNIGQQNKKNSSSN
jgi:hypothetical protein